MSLNAIEIKHVVDSLTPAVCPSVVRKVISPTRPDTIVFELRGPGQNRYLQIVLTPSVTRISTINAKPKATLVPHPFVMLLRRHVVNLPVSTIEQLNNDRVVAISFSGRDQHFTLLCELTSRHSNMFLLGGDNTILGSFFPNRSHKRLLVPQETYVLPFSPPGIINPTSRFPLTPELPTVVEAYYGTKEAETAQTEKRQGLMRMAQMANRRLNRLIVNLEKDLKKAQEAQTLQEYAYVLQTHLNRAKKGMTRFTAHNFQGISVTIPLDPTLDPVANMQKLFNRAKRLKRATPQIDEKYLITLEEKDALETILEQIQTCPIEQLQEFKEKLIQRYPDLAPRAESKRVVQPERLPYREYPISSGHVARVGRSAKDNDTLTLRHSKPLDLWLHVRGVPGSHVVVPMGRGEQPSQDVLIDGAHLALFYSSISSDSSAEIIYTLRKYVQKPKGSAPGSVKLLREKSFLLSVDQKRLQQILGGNQV